MIPFRIPSLVILLFVLVINACKYVLDTPPVPATTLSMRLLVFASCS